MGFRLKLHEQVVNQSTGGNTSIFNKLSGVTIAVSIFFAVLSTESQIDYQFGGQIDAIDWIIGCLFCIEYFCRAWTAPLEG